MLLGSKVKLVPLQKEFLPTIAKWFNDPEVTQFLNWFRPMALESEEDWYRNIQKDTNSVHFAIMLKGDDAKDLPIGNCGSNLDQKNRVGKVGIVIGDKNYWGMGFGTEAMQLLVNYNFKTLNMERVELETFAFNIRAIKSYKRVGFIEEGCRRKAHFINGQYHDVITMGLLRSEWKGYTL
jgi:RimJ/RimL family protein N-acetyltransferase